ncbi:MAG: indolepyruvate ferredoxin oxidoreductase family protein, partial [Acidimicrobiia bacterium]|nr:indolepyruvate ferredoxin oxidoreductase family protein [Acidimicrobiia bacterium]
PARAPHKGPLIELMPARSPYFCSGCPHNSSTKVPEGATVGAGIGCHGMVLLMDPARVGNVIGSTQMGGEGVQWIGIEPFVATDHLIQNVGDGTFFHSASLAIRAAVAADAHITYKILYNGTVAMTGGQDATGGVSVPNLVHMLRHEGVARLLITTDDPGAYKGVELPKGVEVWDRSRIVEAQEALASVPGVTVLVHDQGCAAEKRRDRKRGLVADPDTRIVINELVCEGCGDCGAKSNCLSVQPIETEFGRKTQIHQSSCNKDYSCLDGDCPSFLSVIPAKDSRFASRRSGRADRTKGGARRLPALDPAELRAPRPLVDADDVTVRMPGIGGTGVVTVNQILGTAAMLDGRYVSGLDQTGLSQKAGPVVSDLHISTRPLEGTNKASAGHVDCYLVFDLLVGLGAANLAGASPERTIAVVSTTATPTGSMVRDPSVAYPDEALMRAELDSVTRAADNVYLDAAAVADGLFGETTTSNVVVLGAAYQAGCLPVSAEAIESAIEVNGAAVEANRAAFRWGRMWVIDPDRVRAAMTPADASAPRPDAADLALIGDLDRGELGRLLRVRVPDLVAYQDRAYAERYVALVRTVAAAEDRAVPGATVLAETVARYYHKLLAYKDEYEVARLHLSSAARATVEREVGPGARVAYNLHPPMLRALGLDRKIRVGTWADPALGALARAKRLRGTPVDPFGYAKVRRVERRLAKEYGEVLAMVAARLDAADHGTAVALAALADQVRGYEDVKLRNVELYRREFDQLRRQLGV